LGRRLHIAKYALTSSGVYNHIKFPTTVIKGRKKFRLTANKGYCMVNSFNNAFGSLIIKVEDVHASAAFLNEKNRVTLFGSENGFFHWRSLERYCFDNKLPYIFRNVPGLRNHNTLAGLTSGKFIVIGFSDATNTHAIGIDADNQLVICDSSKGYFSLSARAILNSLPFGVLRVIECIKE
jgi:hypothetical protein